jgi:hypothetical protein
LLSGAIRIAAALEVAFFVAFPDASRKTRLHAQTGAAMTDAFLNHLSSELDGLKSAGLYKSERVISSTQSAEIEVAGQKVLNFCANNYLGLADNADLRDAAKQTLDRYGYGMASVRFICGTQEEHKQLEARISAFLGMEDTILYGSCFDANGGLFETLLGEDDAVISDALNHASIIDGVRLSKAKRFRYANNDMAALEEELKTRRRQPLQADRHRRRVLHGRHHRQPGRRLRPGREVRRDGHGRRQPRRRLRRQARPRLGRSIAASRAASTSSPARWARRWAARPAATPSASGARSSTGCASARGPTCSPTR